MSYRNNIINRKKINSFFKLTNIKYCYDLGGIHISNDDKYKN
jgi:hypothetical protein